MTDLYTVDEAAPRFRHTPEWLAAQLRAGRFPHVKIGRHRYMTDADIEAAIDIMRQRPVAYFIDAGLVAPSDGPTQGLSFTPTSRRRIA